MAHLRRLIEKRPRLWLGAFVVLLAGALLVALARPPAQDTDALQTHVVKVGPFVLRQSFSGRIVPGEQVEVVSPADATLLATSFSYGERVEEGQVLFRLDPGDVWRRQAEARMAWITAEDEASRLAGWSDGPEMRRARRGLDAARDQQEDALRRHDEGRVLFDKGLIARTEMDGLATALRQAGQAVESSTEELEQVLRRGGGVNRELAGIKRGLAGSAWREASQSADVVRAPRAGVMVRPARQGLGDDGGIHSGGKVTAGQSLGVIAALDGLDVLFRVDEADLASLHVGTGAIVTGPGFAGQRLSASLLTVAGEADAGSSGDKTLFAARVRLGDLPHGVADLLRIGMTAQVTLTLYEAPRAISVPVAALVNGGPRVKVRERDGRIAVRNLTLGRIGPDMAEVRAGLAGGEEVVWSR